MRSHPRVLEQRRLDGGARHAADAFREGALEPAALGMHLQEASVQPIVSGRELVPQRTASACSALARAARAAISWCQKASDAVPSL